MNTKYIQTSKLTFLAFAAVLNIVGANLALLFKLPFYFDTLGTFLSASLYGPIYGMATGLISGVITGMTTDIYSFFFLPVQLSVGLLAGVFLSKTKKEQGKTSYFILALFISIPSTFVSSMIAAFVFGGVTSSGSSILVQLLHHMGMNLTLSVFLIQIVTDYIDRVIMLFVSKWLLQLVPHTLFEQ